MIAGQEFYLDRPVRRSTGVVCKVKKSAPLPKSNKLYPHPEVLDRVHRALKMINVSRKSKSQTTWKALDLIDRRPGITQRDIMIRLRYKWQNLLSEMLSDLSDHGFLIITRNGSRAHYEINYDRFEHVNQAIMHLKPTGNKPDRLESLKGAMRENGLYEHGLEVWRMYLAIQVVPKSMIMFPWMQPKSYRKIMRSLAPEGIAKKYCTFHDVGIPLDHDGGAVWMRNFPHEYQVADLIGSKFITPGHSAEDAFTILMMRTAHAFAVKRDMTDSEFVAKVIELGELGMILYAHHFQGRKISKERVKKLSAL